MIADFVKLCRIVQCDFAYKFTIIIFSLVWVSTPSGAALTDTTTFSGNVPFACGLVNGDQSVSLAYNPLSMIMPGYALLSGTSGVITASANGSARLRVQLSTISSAKEYSMQMNVRNAQMGDRSIANPNESNNHTDSFDLEGTLHLKLQLLTTVVDEPENYEIQAVITCFQP